MAGEGKRLRRGERAARIAKGMCPDCGAEAAPYLKCWSCRLKPRVKRSLDRGVRLGALRSVGDHYWIGDGGDAASREWQKWDTPINLPEDDRRGLPRIRGIRVDVEATLVEVIRHLGRPCTIEEIVEAWGGLRAKRKDPLAADLARIVAAKDKRARKMAARARYADSGAAA